MSDSSSSVAVEVRDVTRSFGKQPAVDAISLSVRRGEFLTLLGPSGCGKTTLLRLIAGFEIPDSGSVWLDGQDVTAAPPHRRNVNQVFQSYALFPHLSVAENIAFGLKRQRLPHTEVAASVSEMVALVALEGCEHRRPHQLSGGQKQRVALARALAPRPAVLLLDEPLSALDARLRQAMRLELKRIQRHIGTTFVFVTHDQEEALTMSDRIALMNNGRIEQLADAATLYHRPSTVFGAEFVGETNLVEAEILTRDPDCVRVRIGADVELAVPAASWQSNWARARISIRPEKIQLSKQLLTDRNSFAARIEREQFLGALHRFTLLTDGGVRLIAATAGENSLREKLSVGDRVWAAIHADDVVVLDPS